MRQQLKRFCRLNLCIRLPRNISHAHLPFGGGRKGVLAGPAAWHWRFSGCTRTACKPRSGLWKCDCRKVTVQGQDLAQRSSHAVPDRIWTMDAATTLCQGLAQGSSEALGRHQPCTCPRSLLEVAARGRDKHLGAAPQLLAASTSGHSAEAPPPAASDTAALCGRSAGLSRCGASPALRSRLKRRGGSAASASAASTSAGDA